MGRPTDSPLGRRLDACRVPHEEGPRYGASTSTRRSGSRRGAMSTLRGTIQVNGTDEATMTRGTSRDATQIPYWASGEGPPLMVVHGATADHTRWRPLLPYLEPHATVHALDRRGRGAGGGAPHTRPARAVERRAGG